MDPRTILTPLLSLLLTNLICTEGDGSDWHVHSDSTLPYLERRIYDILKGLESCVVPDEWCIKPPSSSSDIANSHTASTTLSTASTQALGSGPTDPSCPEDAAPSSRPPTPTSASLAPDRRSSRLEAPVPVKRKIEADKEKEKEKEKDKEKLLMRRLAEDFMFVPSGIPNYR
jgi:hypothetical protein